MMTYEIIQEDLKTVAKLSLCLSRKIGAIIIDSEGVVISTGWNGPLLSCNHRYDDDPDLRERLGILNSKIDLTGAYGHCPRKLLGHGSSEGLELCPAIHAEAHAIARAAYRGQSLYDSTMFINCCIPCKDCLQLIISAGIKTVVAESLDFYDQLSYQVLNNSSLTIKTFGGETYVRP